MTVEHHSLAERYGAPPRWRRIVLIAVVVAVVGGFAAVWTWITIEQSDPSVSSELISSEIVDDHTATAVIRVQWGDEPVDATCAVRALAPDKAVVGQATFEPGAGGDGEDSEWADHTVEIATERRATAVENLGCTTDGQPRPR